MKFGHAWKVASLVGFLLGSVTTAYAENDIPSFMVGNQKAVQADIQNVDLSYEVDVAAKSVVATAKVSFILPETGYPVLDMLDGASSLNLNGQSIDATLLASQVTPDSETFVRVLKVVLEVGEVQELVITYTPTEGMKIDDTIGVSILYSMDDLQTGGRGFFEQYGPAGFENDAYPSQISIKLNNYGETLPEYKLIANGDIEVLGDLHWRVSFPEYFVTSSYYMHLFRANRFKVLEDVYEGIAGSIPVTIYGQDMQLVQDGMVQTKIVLAENEGVYGAYAHKKAIAYMTNGGGGMEHCGATITSLWALEHEFTHSWFARGVMPANGNAGWIDEAVASWRDNNYPRNAGPFGTAVNMGGFSPYKRNTNQLAYSKGASLISNFDEMFQSVDFEGQKGMKGILRALFGQKQHQTISVGYFKQFVEGMGGKDLTAIFKKYVFGQVNGATDLNAHNPQNSLIRTIQKPEFSRHPRKFTREERLNLF